MEDIKVKQLHNPTLRVIRILEALDKSPTGLTLSELSKEINSPKSTISPIVNTLLMKDYIIQDKNTAKYKTGIKSFLTGLSFSSNYSSIDIIRNEMQDIVDICNEVCQLGILIDGDVFYLAKVDSEQPINLVSHVGKKLPAYATALGKALLSGYSNEDIEFFYKNGLNPITSNTITDINVLLDQIEKIRNGEVSCEFEEVNKQTACFAIPLKKNNEVVAALSVSFPLFRACEDKKILIKKVLYEKKIIIEQLINQLDLEFQ